MRNTKQKSLVLDIVNRSSNHPTAYEVYQACVSIIPSISLGTVYRNLNSLVELGKIRRLSFLGQVDRYDKVLAHDHFVCMKCHRVLDVSKLNLSNVKGLGKHMVIDCRVCYDGICYDCLKMKEGE